MSDLNQMPDVEPEEEAVEDEGLDEQWEAQAWLYVIWVVIGQRIYCKFGYSTRPRSRYTQLITSIPEKPFIMDMIPCLSVGQAKLLERMLHERLKNYRARGEWFTHVNARQFAGLVTYLENQILDLFRSFGFAVDADRIELGGPRPILNNRGYITHLEETAENDGEEEL